MKIAINTRHLNSSSIDGIGMFTLGILRPLTSLFPESKFYLIYDKKIQKEYFCDIKNIEYVKTKIPLKTYYLTPFWYNVVLKKVLEKIEPDIFIATDGLFPVNYKKCKMISVIHDLNFMTYPKYLPFFLSQFYNKAFSKCAKKSNFILTLSEFSKNEIKQKLKINSSEIEVIYNALSEEQKLEKDNGSYLKFLKKSAYFIILGTISPRKNISNIIKAFELFKNKTKLEHKLVFVGGIMWGKSDIKKTLNQISYKEDVIFTGRVTESEKFSLLSNSEGLIFASKYEGFGIPLLEAMNTQTPIISSNITSLPEIAKEAAFYINPDSPEEISSSMIRFTKDKNLIERLKNEGEKILKLYSWKETAYKIKKVIDKLVIK